MPNLFETFAVLKPDVRLAPVGVGPGFIQMSGHQAIHHIDWALTVMALPGAFQCRGILVMLGG